MAGTNKTVDRLVNIAVCVGAAVVIFGAWRKILHFPDADFWLTVGLLTEAGIFLVYAILPPPGGELAGLAEALPKMTSSGNPALASMDKMLQQADITPTTLGKLSDNFKKLGSSVDQMSDMSSVVTATGDFTAKTKEASNALVSMKDAYLGAASTMKSFNDASEGTTKFHEQVQSLTKNLGSLNTIYELELQDTNNHLKAMNQFYGHLANASEAMKGSVDDAKKTQEQMAVLAKNLGSLNAVYGNMLSAMQGR